MSTRAALLLAGLAASSGFAASASLPFSHREEGALIYENVPASDPALAARLERYLQSRRASFHDWTPEGGMLIGTRFADTEQLHRVSSPLGMREQLTWFNDPVSHARASPVLGSDRTLFLRDPRGDRNAQLYLYTGMDRNLRQLSDGKSLNGGALWAHDGKRIAFHSNRRDGFGYDIYVVDTTSAAEPRLLIGAQQDRWYALDWSADDQKLLVWKYLSLEESYLYVADVDTGALTPVDPTNRKIGIGGARFSPDGRGVYYTSNEAGEFYQLHFVDLYTHENRVLTADLPWDIESFDASADGRYVAYVSNEEGRSRLTVLDQSRNLELSPAGLPDGVISSLRFDRASRQIALTVDSWTAPREIYAYDLEHSSLVRWTRSEIGPVNPSGFVSPQLVRYPTWDRIGKGQRMLAAYYYAPATGGPHPVLVYLHDGPAQQFRPRFDPFIQFVVGELGYAVIAPNVRGSSGYGKSFLRLDDGVLRADAVKDVGSLLVWIGLQPSLDRNRIIVMGNGYGGYLTLASLAAYDDRIRGGIDVSGITNFVSFLENSAAYRRDLRRTEYGDERDPRMRAFLSRISPVANAAAIRRTLLVVQGLNDPHVPARESQTLIATIRAKGGEVWSLAARDEGHGFVRKPNQDAFLQTAALFLQRIGRQP